MHESLEEENVEERLETFYDAQNLLSVLHNNAPSIANKNSEVTERFLRIEGRNGVE